MALLHRAQLSPGKLELVADWLCTQPWGLAADVEPTGVGAYRFDDPAGEVGIETHLVRAGAGPVLQVPVTYRGAPLAGAESWLLGIMEHSVLGRRWVYDACGDPVYAAALASVVLGSAVQAEEHLEVDGRPEPRPASATVSGTGGPAGDVPAVPSLHDLTCTQAGDRCVVVLPGAELGVRRVLDPAAGADGLASLSGTWAGQPEPVVLATARRT